MDDPRGWGSELASWVPFTVLVVGYGVVVLGLFAFGRGQPLERIPDAIRRLTGLPGWVVSSAGTAIYGVLVAGQGFYSDVAWHVALGRDKDLFTAPHTAIVVGLGLIFVSAAMGVTAATVEEVDTRLRVGALRVPWSMLPLAVLGGSAVLGFPLDELWHEAYGIDVTMWSPTHMLMILGASFTGPAVWLVLAEAGLSPADGAWARVAHTLAAALTLLGLTASQGEFDFGVPQFAQVFHPLLITIAAAFSLVTIRLVLGPWRGPAITAVLALVQLTSFAAADPVSQGRTHLYVGSALLVDAVAALAGTRRRLRFALLSGFAVATVGLATEWAWNQGARQPWRAALLPDAGPAGLVVGLGAAVVGAAFAGALLRAAPGPQRSDHDRAAPGEGPGRVPARAVALGAVAVVAVIALYLPRQAGNVAADIRVEPIDGGDRVRVEAVLDPADAADDARWFQVLAWQGGGLEVAPMREVEPGRYVSEGTVPVTGRWKALLRLHRGRELMAAPIRMPADPELDLPEVPAEDRQVALTGERPLLMRETEPGTGLLAPAIHGLLAAAVAAWAATFALVAGRIGGPSRRTPDPAGPAPPVPPGAPAAARPTAGAPERVGQAPD
ncbi:MAG TPA: hypothetical protein VIL48_12525 [Acidimicrobiales bacterium]